MQVTARYGSPLLGAIGSGATVITATNGGYLTGTSTGGTASAPLVADDFIRVIRPVVGAPGNYIAEVMQVVSVAPGVGAALNITVNRDDGTFNGSPPVVSGIYTVNPSTGVVSLVADAVTDYEFPAGSTIENLTTNALLRQTSTGAALDDVFIDHAGGQIFFLNTGATSASSFKVNTGMTVSVFGDYKTASGKRIGFGKNIPILEWMVELEHKLPDGRLFYLRGHKVAVKSENAEFQFNPQDWIGADLQLDFLFDASADPDEPVGYYFIDNDPLTQQPVTDRTRNYSAGSFRLYMTPLDTSIAMALGLPTTRYDIGNVRTGSKSAPQTYLEHWTGVPENKDKVIKMRQEYGLTATIEELTAENLALLFGGVIRHQNSGFAAYNKLVTVAAAPAAPYTLPNVPHPLGRLLLNVS